MVLAVLGDIFLLKNVNAPKKEEAKTEKNCAKMQKRNKGIKEKRKVRLFFLDPVKMMQAFHRVSPWKRWKKCGFTVDKMLKKQRTASELPRKLSIFRAS